MRAKALPDGLFTRAGWNAATRSCPFKLRLWSAEAWPGGLTPAERDLLVRRGEGEAIPGLDLTANQARAVLRLRHFRQSKSKSFRRKP